MSNFLRQNIGREPQAIDHNGPVDFKNLFFDLFFGVGRGLGDHDTAFKNTGLNVPRRFESGAELSGALNRKSSLL